MPGILQVKTSDGKEIFRKKFIKAEEGFLPNGNWNVDAFGALFKSNANFTDKSRGIKVKLGDYIAAPEELLTCYIDELQPTRKIDKVKNPTNPSERIFPKVLVVEPLVENWEEEELLHGQRVKHERDQKSMSMILVIQELNRVRDNQSEQRDLISMLLSENKEMKATLQRMNGPVNAKPAPTKKSVQRKKR